MKRVLGLLIVTLSLSGCDCSMFPGGVCPNPQPTLKPPNQTDILKCAFHYPGYGPDSDVCKNLAAGK